MMPAMQALGSALRFFGGRFLGIFGILATNWRKLVFFIAILIILLPVVATYKEQGITAAAKGVGERVFIPDIHIKESVDSLKSSPPEKRLSYMSISASIVASFLILYWIAKILYSALANVFTNFSPPLLLISTFGIMFFFEQLYIVLVMEELFIAGTGVWLAVSNPLIVLKPFLPGIQFLGRFTPVGGNTTV